MKGEAKIKDIFITGASSQLILVITLTAKYLKKKSKINNVEKYFELTCIKSNSVCVWVTAHIQVKAHPQYLENFISYPSMFSLKLTPTSTHGQINGPWALTQTNMVYRN